MFRRHSHRDLDITTGPMGKNVMRYAMPVFFSGILQLFFYAADSIVVGQYSGSQALAAVSSTGTITGLLVCLFLGLSSGSSILVSRYVGAREYKSVQDTVHTSVLVALLSGIFLAIIGCLLSRPMLHLMGTPDDVIDLAALYLKIIFLGMPLQMVYNFCSSILRAVGDTKRPLYFLTTAGVVNVILNLFFVIVFHMSVAGVALATVISQAVSALLVVHSLSLREDATRLFYRKLRINPRIMLKLLHLGLPAGIQSATFSISGMLIQSSINSFGSIAMAGIGAATSIGGFIQHSLDAFSQANTCFVSQNFGARKPRRMLRAVYTCLGLGSIFIVVFSALTIIFGRPLLSLYVDDPAAIDWGMIRIIYLHIPYVLGGVQSIFLGALRGIGYSILAMCISLIGICGVRIIWLYTAFAVWPTMQCLIISYGASWLFTAPAAAICFFLLYKRLCKEYTAEELAEK